MYFKIGITIIILSTIIGVSWFAYKKFLVKKAAKIGVDIYAVWATQGPFENGEDSAKAMRRAVIVARGMDALEDHKFIEAIKLHAKAYNSDPQRWEALRKESLSMKKSKDFDKHIEMVKQIVSNDAALSNFGERLAQDTSAEAKDLLRFLKASYGSRFNKEIETVYEIGFIYAQIYSESFRHPDEEFYKLFLDLHKKWNDSEPAADADR